jgi:hypothetical protein
MGGALRGTGQARTARSRMMPHHALLRRLARRVRLRWLGSDELGAGMPHGCYDTDTAALRDMTYWGLPPS